MGCCQGSLLTSSAEVELRNARVKSRAHLQALSSIAQDLLGDSYRTGVIAKAQDEGKEQLELSSRVEDRAMSQAYKCASIVDMTKYENDNVLLWLKVRQENEIRREQIGVDEVQRQTRGGVEVGIDPTALLGGVPLPSAKVSFSGSETAGDVCNKTIIELTTHVLSFKDAYSPENNINSLKDDVKKVDSVLQSWANPDPKYGELWVEAVHVGGRLTIEYRSTQGLGEKRRQSEAEAAEVAAAVAVAEAAAAAKEKADDFAFPGSSTSTGTGTSTGISPSTTGSDTHDGDKALAIATNAAKEVGDQIGDQIANGITETMLDKLGIPSANSDDEDGDVEAGRKETGTEGSNRATVKSSGGGLTFDPASGVIGFKGQTSTSDDDWEFTIKVEGGDTNAFDKKPVFRGKKGLELLNTAQKKWIKSIKAGITPTCIWMELNRVRYLAAAVATDPKKVREHFNRISGILDKQAHDIQTLTSENAKLRSKSTTKEDMLMLLNERDKEAAAKRAAVSRNSSAQASAVRVAPILSPEKQRKLSTTEKHLHDRFQSTLQKLTLENSRLIDVEATKGVNLEEHQNSIHAIATDLENEFAELMGELIVEHEARLKEAASGGGGKGEGEEGAAHVRFARKMQRVKTITRSALKKHRSRVRHLKENSGKMADDLTLARSKLGNRYGADGIDDSQTDADGRARKELKRPVTVFSRFRPFRSNVGELPAQGETPTYSIDSVVDDSGEEISKLKLEISGKTEYNLDQVFDDNAPDAAGTNMQEMVFDNSAALLVPKMLAGFNVTLMAYGQTGSGKSFSMYGPGDKYGELATEPLRGMIPRLLEELLTQCRAAMAAQQITSFTFEAQLFELYNEELNDLLGSRKRKMRLVPDTSCKSESGKTMKSYWCKDATIFKFDTAGEALVAIGRGMRNRQMASTNKNHESSRSHAILAIRAHTSGPLGGRISKVNLIDLAGSEKRAATMGVSGEAKRAKEGANINKSLLQLGIVINSLAKGKKVATYRNSMLTRLLQDSLGGNAYLMLITCMSPAKINAEMTRSTAQFSQRCRGLKNVVKVNYSKSIAEYERDLKLRDESVKLLGGIVTKMEKHNEQLNEELDAAQVLLEDMVSGDNNAGAAAGEGSSGRGGGGENGGGGGSGGLLDSVRGIHRQQSLFVQNTAMKEDLQEAMEAVRLAEAAGKVREEEAQAEAMERALSEAAMEAVKGEDGEELTE